MEISVAEIRRKNDFACLRAAEIELEVHRCNLRIVRNLETELSGKTFNQIKNEAENIKSAINDNTINEVKEFIDKE